MSSNSTLSLNSVHFLGPQDSSIGNRLRSPDEAAHRFPRTFNPPSAASTPRNLFHVGTPPGTDAKRYIRKNDPGTVLVYTDGACINNGYDDARAGWAVVFRPRQESMEDEPSGRLELEGPDGIEHEQTSNRAELRAAIAALVMRDWAAEGFHTLVIATDSEYVVKGATQWVKSWTSRDWKTCSGANVKNKDLWEEILLWMEVRCGVEVKFWRIPRSWNVIADAAARKAAREDDVTSILHTWICDRCAQSF